MANQIAEVVYWRGKAVVEMSRTELEQAFQAVCRLLHDYETRSLGMPFCRTRPPEERCDFVGSGGFMGHTCKP